MSLFTPNANALYSLQCYGTSTYLSANGLNLILAGDPFGWEFLPSQNAEQYLMRPSSNNQYCVDVQGGVPTVRTCSSEQYQWSLQVQEGGIYSGSVEIVAKFPGLAAEGALAGFAPGIGENQFSLSGIGADDEGVNAWVIQSIGDVNDNSWSTLPYGAAATSSTAQATTAAPTAMTSNTAPAAITTTSNGNTAAPTNNPTETSSSFSFSVSEKNLPSAIASIVLPSDVNVGCELCEGSGNYALSIGGYTSEDDDAETVLNFLENGYINIDISQIVATLSMDLQLLPGFQPVSTFLIAASGVLTRRISKTVTLTGKYKIGIPLNITLDSAITLDGGVAFEIPGDINIHIVPHSIDQSSISGVDFSNVSALPFSISAPNFAFDIATGLRIQVELSIDASAEEHVSASGSLTLTADTPRLDAAFQALSNVNSQCQSPGSGDTVYQQAVQINPTGDFEVTADGDIELALSLADLKTTTTLAATEFPVYSTSSALPTQCLYDKKLKASFLNTGHSIHTNLLGKRWLFAVYGALALLRMLL